MIIGYPEAELQQRMKAITADYYRQYGGKKGDTFRKRLFEQSDLCALGGKPLPSCHGVFASLDHKISKFDYASMPLTIQRACELANAEENLQLVCQKCNSRKNRQDLEDNPQLTFDCDGPLSPEEIREYQRRRSEGGRKGGHIGGRKTMALHPELHSLGGRIQGPIQGRKNAQSGQMASVGRVYGPINGRKNVQSGHLDLIRTHEGSVKGGHIGGRLGGLKGGHTQGRKNVENGHLAFARHIRWHVKPGHPNPNCALCKAQASAQVNA